MCLSVVGRVRSIEGEAALLDVDGTERRVSLAPLLLTGTAVGPGDWVVAQTGLAVSVLDAEDAEQVLAARRELFDEEGT